MELDKRVKYSMELAMLKQLLDKKLITKDEYDKVLLKIRKDYGVVSDLTS